VPAPGGPAPPSGVRDDHGRPLRPAVDPGAPARHRHPGAKRRLPARLGRLGGHLLPGCDRRRPRGARPHAAGGAVSAEQPALLPGNPPPPLGERDITPLTVLHTARKEWQARRRAWLDAGLDDGDGREHIAEWPTITPGEGIRWQRRVSIFDPVLAEVLILWHTRPGDVILDPFAGGPVRGLVAAHLGRHYIGIDISPTQVAANETRLLEWPRLWLLAGPVTWHVGPAQQLLPEIAPESADYVLTCPPYHDLERYTDDPADLSAMTWEEYVEAV